MQRSEPCTSQDLIGGDDLCIRCMPNNSFRRMYPHEKCGVAEDATFFTLLIFADKILLDIGKRYLNHHSDQSCTNPAKRSYPCLLGCAKSLAIASFSQCSSLRKISNTDK